MKFIVSIIFFLSVISSSSQTYIDSLKQIIQTPNHDTILIQTYIMLSDYFKASNADSALYYNSLAEKIVNKLSGHDAELTKGEIIRIKGIIYYYLSDYNKALNFFQESEKIASKNVNNTNEKIKLKAKKLHAASLGNIGLIYHELGNYAKALSYYFNALKINSEIKNKKEQSANLGNIGVLYADQGNNFKALDYYKKALKISQEIGNKSYIASDYGNIATIHHKFGEYNKAEEYYLKALNIDKEIQNKNGVARHLGNLGSINAEKGNYSKALEFYFKAFELCKESGNIVGQAINMGNIGNLYFTLEQYDLAEDYLKKAEQINKKLGTLYYLKSNAQNLSQLYEKQNKYKDALYYYKEFTHAKDSLNSQENRKALQTMELKYQYEKEQAVKEKEHQKQLEIQRKEKERQQTISYAVGSGLFLVIIFSMFIFNRLQVTRKQKQVIEAQKQQVESQKLLVEEKNKEITDSITYAKRIQNAILPSEEQWQKYLPNSFVYYLPKDIVAGDFYWLETVGEALETTVYFAAADCTGHGVPGAMVSVVCSNALTKTVVEEKITEPGKILDRTRELVIERFAKSSEDVKDGMDISLCAIDFKNMTLQWAGANNPLWIVRNVELEMLNDESKNEYSTFNTQNLKLIEIKPDKQPIGKVENPQPFTTHTIELQKGDTIYIFTDGFADQFGGEKGKKFKYKPFKELLLSIQDKSMDEQKQIIEETFIKWKGDLEQVDDVCVIGVKI